MNGTISPSLESDSEDEEESTYAFSTLDSDFIAWMRLSVKNVTSSHPCYAFRRAESLAALTQQEVVNIANIFNTNPLGLRMNLVNFCIISSLSLFFFRSKQSIIFGVISSAVFSPGQIFIRYVINARLDSFKCLVYGELL